MIFTTIGQAKKQVGVSYLGGVNISSKIKKNMKINVMTYVLYLSPANTSGYNVCSHSTPECRLGCLATSGRAAMDIICNANRISRARNIKTKLFFEDNNFFMSWLVSDIAAVKKVAESKGYIFSVRLNGTSDIDWGNTFFNGMNIFEIFNDVPFYDYTKNHSKFKNIAPNYHLTYSYTGRNWIKCEQLLNLGFNVAMVFNVKDEKDLPLTFRGYKIINGDLNDYRIADAKGIIIGLKWKRIANKEAEKKILNSCFVVQPNSIHCTSKELKTVLN